MTELVFRSGDQVSALIVTRSPLARRMGIRVDSLGRVRLTLPPRAPLAPAYAWAETKRGWIEGQLAKVPRGEAIGDGMTLTFAGERLTLDWAESNLRGPKRVGDRLIMGGPEPLIANRLLRWLQREAKILLTQETLEFAAKAGVSIASVGIGDPVSRWGSCASSGAIRYSWRLILAPAFVRRATVAHEVAHRVHMDHSKRFHALVAELLGADPAPARRWLRANAGTIQGFGRAA